MQIPPSNLTLICKHPTQIYNLCNKYSLKFKTYVQIFPSNLEVIVELSQFFEKVKNEENTTHVFYRINFIGYHIESLHIG